MKDKLNVLDHGFVVLRNLSGPTRRTIQGSLNAPMSRAFDADDTDPANAARMSFDGQDQDRTYEAEMKLNRYLMKNKHMTPFEMVVVWLEMKLPLFVARQFVRHGTARLNEISGRYVKLPAEWYIPAIVGASATDKKQGASDQALAPLIQTAFQSDLNGQCKESYRLYENYIRDGVANEHARLFLHVNHYTHWLWKQDLRNLMGFLLLRDHAHAQIEAQLYAQAITQLLAPHIPGLMQLYEDIMKGEGK